MSPERRLRLSDADRSQAMDRLGHAMSEGRISINEYDTRCRAITTAQFTDEITPLFHDLPVPAEKTYTASEIARARKASAYPRAGVFLLATLATILTTGLTDIYWFLLLIPAVFILLYLIKIGPASWYTPTEAQVERARLKQLRNQAKIRNLEQRQRSREARAELTSKAFRFAHDQIDKRRG